MGSSKMAMLAPMWILMALWLTLVAVAGVLAFRKWHTAEEMLDGMLPLRGEIEE
jgi:hypothetical protein